jgi:tetratricopeptide (TPR) repeat protein
VVLPDTESLLADVGDVDQRTALLTWLARWLSRFAHDEDAAERRLVEAAELSPGSVAVAEALSQLYRNHGEWARAAEVLVRTGNATPEPEDAVSLLLEAARIIHTRVGDADGATGVYRRILELDPKNITASEALTDLAAPSWTRRPPASSSAASWRSSPTTWASSASGSTSPSPTAAGTT